MTSVDPGPRYASVNPATGAVLEEFPNLTAEALGGRLAAASIAARGWAATPVADRARLLVTAAGLLEGELPDIAYVLTTEMGKPFAQAKGEVAKCAAALRWFAEHGPAMLADEPVVTSASRSLIRIEPLGPVLAVMPWNFPLWQVIRFAAPNLLAGNVGLLKHAPSVPRSALLIEYLFTRAGAPPGVFQTLLIDLAQTAEVIADPRVAAVTLTGSVRAGRAVAERAGAVGKKAVLELGGSDPFIVLPSADLSRAVPVGVQARVQNNGQSCIAAKRFIVHEDVADAFTGAFVAAMAALSVGDPLDPATEVGPLVSGAARATLAAQVEDARDKGATVLCGGSLPAGPGYYYPPTVLTGITPDMRVATEEVFGPVALLTRVAGSDDALAVANGTAFGLGASVWTRDPDEQQRFIDGLAAGQVFVNTLVASTPELPFGGVKASGFGRELSSYGLREFCNVKAVWVA